MPTAVGVIRSAAAATSAPRQSSGRRCQPWRPATARRCRPSRASEAWLRHAAGDVTAGALRSAILRRYGKDQTFSVPILTVLALTRQARRRRRGLAFGAAAAVRAGRASSRVVSVSAAAGGELRAAGADRDRAGPAPLRAVAQPLARALRNRVRRRTHSVLREMQPESGGYLEATPLTSFVVMSLAGMRRTSSPVVESGVRFLIDSMREDGSWAIDTNLATWVTTLSIGALADAGALARQRRRSRCGAGCSISRQRASIRLRTRRLEPGRGRRSAAACRMRTTRPARSSRCDISASPLAKAPRRPRRRAAGCSDSRIATAASRRFAAAGARCPSIAAHRRSPRTRSRRGAAGTRISKQPFRTRVRQRERSRDRVSRGKPASRRQLDSAVVWQRARA